MSAILMFHNCEGQSHKTVSTDHNFYRERRAEANSNVFCFGVCVCECVFSPLRDVLSASVGPVSESELEICSV